jgi:hypothetical protein
MGFEKKHSLRNWSKWIYLIGSEDRFVGIVAYFPLFLEKLLLVGDAFLSTFESDVADVFDVAPFRLKLNSGMR